MADKLLKSLNFGGSDTYHIGWDSLQDKPFGEETTMGDTLTWDGNTDGLVSVDMGDGSFLYKISDATPTLEEAQQGGTIIMNGEATVFASDLVMSMNDKIYTICNMQGGLIVLEDNADFFGVTIPHKGFYMMMSCEFSITINGYNGFETKTIKPIDTKYLPFSIFVINMVFGNDGSVGVDKTFDEIVEAFNRKELVYVYADGMYMHSMATADENGEITSIDFQWTIAIQGMMMVQNGSIAKDGTVTSTMEMYQLTPMG